MSTEDAPAAPKGTLQTGTLAITCAAGCGATDRVPAYADKGSTPPVLRAVAATPWVCLSCWRLGNRPIGPLSDGSWKIENVSEREKR